MPSDIDLAAVVADELEQFRGAQPRPRIELVATDDSRGQWDAQRLQQLLRNVISNAIRHGASTRQSMWPLAPFLHVSVASLRRTLKQPKGDALRAEDAPSAARID